MNHWNVKEKNCRAGMTKTTAINRVSQGLSRGFNTGEWSTHPQKTQHEPFQRCSPELITVRPRFPDPNLSIKQKFIKTSISPPWIPFSFTKFHPFPPAPPPMPPKFGSVGVSPVSTPQFPHLHLFGAAFRNHFFGFLRLLLQAWGLCIQKSTQQKNWTKLYLF